MSRSNRPGTAIVRRPRFSQEELDEVNLLGLDPSLTSTGICISDDPGVAYHSYEEDAVSYTHLTLPTIYSV